MQKQNISLILGLVLSGVILLLMLSSFVWTPHDPLAQDATNRLAAPSGTHPFGTDNLGRDILSRILVGTGTTLLVALGTVLIGTLGGIIVGSLTGYFGGWLDELFMRLSDALTAFPTMLLALVVISLIGSGTANVIWVLGILFIPSFARVLRGEFARCRNLDYVKRAKLMGASSARVMFRHILPNAMPVFLSTVAIGFNNAVLAEAGMSFLGIGVQMPDISLGRILDDSHGYLVLAPWWALLSGAMIALIVLGFSLLSDGLQRRGRKLNA